MNNNINDIDYDDDDEKTKPSKDGKVFAFNY